MSPILSRILKALLPPVVLGVAGAGAYVMYINRPPVETQIPVVAPPAVRVQRVAFQSVDLTVSSQGTVQPRTASQLVPEIAGTVINVSPAFAVGGFFEEGDVLLEIDPYDYQQALIAGQSQRAQARLRLAQEEAAAEMARREWDELVGGNANALTLREPQVEDARAAVASAEAAIDRARRDLERAQVRAPYAGRVQSKDVDIGQFVNRGTAVGRIYAVDSAEVRLPLPDEELAYVDVPMSYRGTQQRTGPGVVLSADFAGRRFTWRGQIVRTEGEIDPVSRMVHVVAEVDDPYAPGPDPTRPPLAVGMFVEAEISGRRVDDVVVLPWAALNGRDQVLIVDDDGRLRYRQVEVLRSTSEYVLVRSGLAEGERVSISALDAVIDGMAVQVTEDEPAMARAEADAPAAGRGPETPATDPVAALRAERGPNPAARPDAVPAAGAPDPGRMTARETPRPDRPAATAAPAPEPRREQFDIDPTLPRNEQIAAIRRRIAELRGNAADSPPAAARAAAAPAEDRMARAEPERPRVPGGRGPGSAAARNGMTAGNPAAGRGGSPRRPDARMARADAPSPGRPGGPGSRSPGAGVPIAAPARSDAPPRAPAPMPARADAPTTVEAVAPVVAMLPFRNVSRNPADDIIGEEMRAVLRIALERAAGMRVVLLAPGDESDAIQRAMASQATWVARGAYQRVGEQLRVTGRIIDVATGQLIGSVRVDGTVTGRDALTSRLIAALRSELTGNMPAAAAPRMAAAAPAPRAAPDPPRAPDTRRAVQVAVSPFTNISRNPADDPISDTVAEEIAGQLGRIPGIAVLTLDTRATDGPAALSVAAARGADWLVTGGYQHVGGQLRLTARLLQVSDGAFVESAKVDGSMDRLSDMLVEALSTLGAALAANAAGS
jgi:RND family efflux transporter MFP subunit